MIAEPDADLELLPRLCQNDRAAWQRLVTRHHRGLVSVARSLVGDAQAEEVVQDAWLAACRYIGGFEGRASLRTWLTRITVNEARRRLRGNKATVSVSDWEQDEALAMAGRFDAGGHWKLPPALWHADSPEALLDAQELRFCLEKHLAALPEAQRQVLVLRDREGLEFNEIAEVVAASEANLRVMLHRARVKLWAMIDRFQEVGEC